MNEKTMHKWFWVWDFEKEEQWLNEMALQGWVLSGVGFCRYTFTACEPGEYQVRLIMADDREGCIGFVESTGAEYVGNMAKWLYFRQKTQLGEFELLSDLDSRVEHMKRIERMLIIVGALNLLSGLNPVSSITRINLLCACLLCFALGRIQGARYALEQERMVHE